MATEHYELGLGIVAASLLEEIVPNQFGVAQHRADELRSMVVAGRLRGGRLLHLCRPTGST